MKDIKNYTDLMKLKTFEERYNYLKLDGQVGQETFGFERHLNQGFYRSEEWKRIRDQVIIRDNGCDLGMKGYEMYDNIIIHHMNPIGIQDVLDRSDFLVDPEYLICTRHSTHNAIHYGDASQLVTAPVERTPNDTCPWKK